MIRSIGQIRPWRAAAELGRCLKVPTLSSALSPVAPLPAFRSAFEEGRALQPSKLFASCDEISDSVFVAFGASLWPGIRVHLCPSVA